MLSITLSVQLSVCLFAQANHKVLDLPLLFSGFQVGNQPSNPFLSAREKLEILTRTSHWHLSRNWKTADEQYHPDLRCVITKNAEENCCHHDHTGPSLITPLM